VGNAIGPHFERAAENIATLQAHLAPAAAIVPYAARASDEIALPLAAARSLVGLQ
jgi:hypothetical protein